MLTPIFDLSKIKDIQASISLVKSQNQKHLIPTLKTLLKEEKKKFINQTTPHDERHLIYLKAMQSKIKELKLSIKDFDRKGSFDQVSQAKKELELFKERLKLSVFMYEVSSSSDY